MTTSVDVLANYSSEFSKMSALPTFERKIAREGIVPYERDRLDMQMV